VRDRAAANYTAGLFCNGFGSAIGVLRALNHTAEAEQLEQYVIDTAGELNLHLDEAWFQGNPKDFRASFTPSDEE
jgi:hypothetical protein